MENKQEYFHRIQALLNHADININGSRPYDLQIHSERTYQKVLAQGSLGLGEAYMDGDWSCSQLDELFCRLLRAELGSKLVSWRDRAFFVKEYLRNRQTRIKAKQVARQHYDIGNDLYAAMLDPLMLYSCGYWRDADQLDIAQIHKLELVAKKLDLSPGMRVLDIGCGWGGAASYLQRNYGVDVHGISIAEAQIRYAQDHHQQPGLEFELCDYRDMADSKQGFDAIYSIGMFEHVGFKNYSTFFTAVANQLKPQGRFLLHCIGHPKTSYRVDPWIARYIFPNSILPSKELIKKYALPTFFIQDWHEFDNNDYYKTLMAWSHNCDAAWPELSHYEARFQRMWHYYLGCCAGAFKAGRNHLWQILFSKGQASVVRPIRSVI